MSKQVNDKMQAAVEKIKQAGVTAVELDQEVDQSQAELDEAIERIRHELRLKKKEVIIVEWIRLYAQVLALQHENEKLQKLVNQSTGPSGSVSQEAEASKGVESV